MLRWLLLFAALQRKDQRADIIPSARRADWYARRVGVAAAREINEIPAAQQSTDESRVRAAGIRRFTRMHADCSEWRDVSGLRPAACLPKALDQGWNSSKHAEPTRWRIGMYRRVHTRRVIAC